MLADASDLSSIKIADFGYYLYFKFSMSLFLNKNFVYCFSLSKNFSEGDLERMDEVCGTIQYMAPGNSSYRNPFDFFFQHFFFFKI